MKAANELQKIVYENFKEGIVDIKKDSRLKAIVLGGAAVALGVAANQIDMAYYMKCISYLGCGVLIAEASVYGANAYRALKMQKKIDRSIERLEEVE